MFEAVTWTRWRLLARRPVREPDAALARRRHVTGRDLHALWRVRGPVRSATGGAEHENRLQ